MKQRVSLTIEKFVIEKVDDIADGLNINRSRAVEDLLQFAFDFGATVENGKLACHSEKIRFLEEQVEWFKQLIDALARKQEVSK